MQNNIIETNTTTRFTDINMANYSYNNILNIVILFYVLTLNNTYMFNIITLKFKYYFDYLTKRRRKGFL